MMHEGRIASAYWTELSKIFNKLYPEFHFETRLSSISSEYPPNR